MEKTKKQNKTKEENRQKKHAKYVSLIPQDPYKGATPRVKPLFYVIEEKLNALKTEEKWLSVESIHHLTETFPKDFKNYKELYQNINDKQSVEEEVVRALQFMMNELENYETEIEEKKKIALQRQEYIMEKREKHL